MARIPEAELERLKREVSLERLVTSRGVALRRHGADLVGLCPFHDDHEPSLVVSPQKNLWHCLGACQAGGSTIDWVMRAEGVSFRHAVELLQSGELGSGAVRPTRFLSKRRHLPPPVVASAPDPELLGEVMAFYRDTFEKNLEPQRYLEHRGLVHPELVSRFGFGYANRTLGYRLPSKDSKTGDELRSRLQAVGLLRPSGHELFTGCLVIPIHDEAGRVVGMYGRKIRPDHKQRPESPLHLYLPGPHRGIFNLAALAASPEVILCESLLDALSFWCAGFRNVTCSYGVEGFTPELLSALLGHGTERLLMAYDRDPAGDQAAEKLAARLSPHGIACYRVEFPRGMDANDYLRTMKPAERAFDLVMRKARPMGEVAERKTSPARYLPPALPASAEASPPPLVQPDQELPVAELAPDMLPLDPSSMPALPLAASSSPPLLPSDPATSLLPAAPLSEPELERRAHELVLSLGDRRYRVRGIERNLTYDVLKVNLLCARGEGFHVDALDLYSARQRAAFLKQAALEMGVEERAVQKDLGQLLLRLEALQQEQIEAALAPKEKAAVPMSDEERRAAEELLGSPDLLARIVSDLSELGVVGEETNKLVTYLAATSRQLERPLAVIVQSSSAAGKSVLLDAVLALMPEEQRVSYSAMTGQSLFYMGETDLSHKILAIAEEQGAERASYALKLLQSEGELTIASTGKDPQTGRLVTHEYRVQGPVAILLTTTAIDLDEELRNRCLVLAVDESREQTRAIHERQREAETLAGLARRRRREKILQRHRNAQRLLRPLAVVNPFAQQLTFLDSQTRTRRDHPKYLALIRSIALLHQRQRPVKVRAIDGEAEEYIEVTLADLELANRLADEVLGRSLDELPPQTRRVLGSLDSWVSSECERLRMERCDFRFSRREAREALGLSYEQLRVHLGRLVGYEYLLVHHGGRGQSFVYELAYDGRGKDGRPTLSCLIDVEALRSGSTADSLGGLDLTLGGEEPDLVGSSRPQTGALPGPNRSGKKTARVSNGKASLAPGVTEEGIAAQRLSTPQPTYAAALTHTESPLVGHPLVAAANGREG